MRKNPEITQEEIDSYILNLVYEPFISRLQELNFEKVTEFYWNINGNKEKINPLVAIPEKDIFNFNDKKNLISILADHLDKYFRNHKIHYTNAPV